MIGKLDNYMKNNNISIEPNGKFDYIYMYILCMNARIQLWFIISIYMRIMCVCVCKPMIVNTFGSEKSANRSTASGREGKWTPVVGDVSAVAVTCEDKLRRPFCGQPRSHGINRHRVEGRHSRRRHRFSRQVKTSVANTHHNTGLSGAVEHARVFFQSFSSHPTNRCRPCPLFT